MKLIYKILILFYSILIITVIVWLFIPIHKTSKPKIHVYTLFDSTFFIKTPFLLTTDTLKTGPNTVLDTLRNISYYSKNIEFEVECIKFRYPVPAKNKKGFLNTWLTSMDSIFQSVSTLKKEKLINISNQKFEYYDGIINYLHGHPPTNHNKRYFSTLISSKREYIYFIDMRYNESDEETIDIRDKVFNSIIIK
jgi:hypothetical protein